MNGALTDAQIATVFECLKDDSIVGEGVSTGGTVPVAVFQLFRGPPNVVYGLFIAWRVGDAWWARELRDGGFLVDERVVASADSIREQTIGDQTLVALIVDGPSGSTSPHMRPVLLAYEQNRWRVRWLGGLDEMTFLNARRSVRFDGIGIERLIVEGDVFAGASDGLVPEVFLEANAGAHRHYTQVWELRGDAYVLVSNTAMASPYNTLIEFTLALRAGDNTAARSLATSDAIVDAAIQLGLADSARSWWSSVSDAPWDGSPASGALHEALGNCSASAPTISLEFVDGADGPVIASVTQGLPSTPCTQ